MSYGDKKGHDDSDTIQAYHHDVTRSPIVEAMTVHNDATTKVVMGPHGDEKHEISRTDSDLKTTMPAGQYVDTESQDRVGSIDREEKEPPSRYSWGWFYGIGRPYIHAAIWVLFTVFVFPTFSDVFSGDALGMPGI